jgi:pimeloyl-ACP methyl ester carboxylesterase
MLRRVQGIQQPCLILRGQCDPIAPHQWVEALASTMPNAEARTVPGAGHALNYNSPNIVVEESLRFWRERGLSV